MPPSSVQNPPNLLSWNGKFVGQTVRLSVCHQTQVNLGTGNPPVPGMYDVRMGTQNVRVEALSGPDAQGFFRIRVNGVEQEIQVLSSSTFVVGVDGHDGNHRNH